MRIAALPAVAFQLAPSALRRSPASVPAVLQPFGRDTLQVNTRLPLSPAVAAASGPEPAYAVEMAKISHVGPRLEALPDFSVTPLRIGLALHQTSARFSVQNATLRVSGPAGEQTVASGLSGELEARALPQGFALYHQGQLLGRFAGQLDVDNGANTLVVNGQLYRGNLRLLPAPDQPDKLHVLNTVMLEDYLRSVAPSESPASWPLESLKAQALAARTYAVANWGKHQANGFDMRNDTADQMYKGVASEHPGTNVAVEATRGQIIQHGGRPITALFFSSSGGYTDSSAEVWGTALAYIQPRPDFDQASPRYRWQLQRSQADLQAAVRKLELNLGVIQDIIPLSRTPQGRVKELRIVGSQGNADVNANRFRFAAGLYSTRWDVGASGSGNQRRFTFDGGGWGHGLGMSQWGARQMAADGRSAAEIIHHYYTDVQITELSDASAP
ncbi:MAG: SpoIID/LytB domain-containing protein [Candidatus Sericytochromatia bacterium]|nr:SpoIID/LytB domain-containing protein [Candidatus Sericytochromatia bacterium]